MSIKNLTRQTHRMLQDQRSRQPVEQGFQFSRDQFSAGDWSRLVAFLEAIKQPANCVQWRGMPKEQQCELMLWACLQEENDLQHKKHAAIIRQWLSTPWSASVARLVELYNQGQGQLPGIPYNRYGLNSVAQDYVDGREVSIGWRLDIRCYLLRQEQGEDFVPCIDKRAHT